MRSGSEHMQEIRRRLLGVTTTRPPTKNEQAGGEPTTWQSDDEADYFCQDGSKPKPGRYELCKPLHMRHFNTSLLNKFNVSGKICELCFLNHDPDDPDMMKTYNCKHRNITVNCEHNIQKDGCSDTFWDFVWSTNFCRILCNNKWRVRESCTYIQYRYLVLIQTAPIPSPDRVK